MAEAEGSSGEGVGGGGVGCGAITTVVPKPLEGQPEHLHHRRT